MLRSVAFAQGDEMLESMRSQSSMSNASASGVSCHCQHWPFDSVAPPSSFYMACCASGPSGAMACQLGCSWTTCCCWTLLLEFFVLLWTCCDATAATARHVGRQHDDDECLQPLWSVDEVRSR